MIAQILERFRVAIYARTPQRCIALDRIQMEDRLVLGAGANSDAGQEARGQVKASLVSASLKHKRTHTRCEYK